MVKTPIVTMDAGASVYWEIYDNEIPKLSLR